MIKYISLMYVGVGIAAILSGCGTTSPNLRLLEKRANYNPDEPEVALLNQSSSMPERTKTIVTDIYVHPHEMATRDYFRGGWIRTIVSEPRWAIAPAAVSKTQPGFKNLSPKASRQKEKQIKENTSIRGER